jgi:hypothetical protein
LLDYLFFGQWIRSSIELPGIIPLSSTCGLENPIQVSFGKTPKELTAIATVTKPFSKFNQTEFLYTFPDIAIYYVRNGNEIVIEPLTENEFDSLLYFYSSALAIALFQRNLIPFHASGIKINQNQVVLFPADSGVGKSTTAVFLEKKGYGIFSDDTVLLEIKDNKCYATPSYPIMRLWENTLEVSKQDAKDLYQLRPGIDKYGVYLRNKFTYDKMEVAALVFLQKEGDEIRVAPLHSKKIFLQLIQNVYGKQWIQEMNKQLLQFELVSKISQTVPGFSASRPRVKDTLFEFSDALENEIITKLNANVK